ncbi:hypothetical protein RGF97_13735 [Streptomyces roseicoloratus]|uniref:Uncharacterized protein n=1 Tax=Streptomyces roseicoloratus TaxID=2508722 RepID=A0ABY9RU49_9ACTN|nr:hypothetical protein [Streptomyces roseicoloratus]WMX45700.1 hypothetical protein RGF97_13735 [Streptomyces roseicoloratus]
MSDQLELLTRPTEFLDYETDAVQAFIDHAVKDRSADRTTNAIELYYAVRDDVFYEVYGAPSPARASGPPPPPPRRRASACTSPRCTRPVCAPSASPPGSSTATCATTSPRRGC